MATRTARRLPGFRFEVQSPQLSETLPRMDVAVFVGFAASGPLHVPVAVEDAAQFTAIYGDDVPLVWDHQRGEQVYGYLARTVQAFFRNGGRRCWIVRVAGDQAQSNYFPIPGLALAEFNEQGKVKQISPTVAVARSEGSWSDSLRVSTTLFAQPIRITNISEKGHVIDLVLNSPKDLVKGDLLRISFHDQGYILFLPVDAITQLPAGSPPDGSTTRVTSSRALWFSTRLLTSPPLDGGEAKAWVCTHGRVDQSSMFTFDSIPALIHWKPDQSISLDLSLSLADAPTPGSLVRVDLGTEQLWLMVQNVGVEGDHGSPPSNVIQVTGQAFWWLKDAPQPLPTLVSASEKLSFELWVRQGNTYGTLLSNLGFTADHARFWGDLPTDEKLYQDKGKLFEEERVELAFDKERVELRRATAQTRFPLAGSGVQDALYIPIGMPNLPDYYLGPVRLPGARLERDGLAEFDASLFLDPDLIEVGTTSFMAQADFLRYQSLSPHRLKGIHAALGFGESTIIEEATIVAVPDAVHRGWRPAEEESFLPAEKSKPFPRPEWWHYLDCDPPAKIPLEQEPHWGNFLNCDLRIIPAPTLYLAGEPGQTGTFTLHWGSDLAGAQYILEESTRPNFNGAVRIYTGTEGRFVIHGRSPGEYYYRVHAEVNCVTSDWSNEVPVRVSPGVRYQLQSLEQYSSDILLAVHRALLRMCAAHGDLFTVLSLPEHYREDEAIAHVAVLKSPTEPPLTIGRSVLLALSSGEASTFSYAAVYHPWLIDREGEKSNILKRTPPDGVACGILAQRAMTRGAWVAPANEALRGVVALTPSISREHWLKVQEAQINLIRQEPRGFVVVSADTLSNDVDLRPINVRRLMILLRRLALRLGATYVFEPNDDSFRRLVQRGFEAMLTQMFIRGAFAGATPATSFQVVTDSSLNTVQSVEQGRFIVELRVAPSLPLTFLTIRLVQSGDRGFAIEGR